MCMVGWCNDNNKVVSVVVGWSDRLVGVMVVLVFWVLVRLGLRDERTPSHALPRPKLLISDSIFTDLHTLTIHISVYLIPVFQII